MVWNGAQRAFLWQSKLFLRKCTVSFIYLWVSSGMFRRVGVTDITLQPSVFRLHVALIDFSPSLLKCTINQYSNKSSFILEKCSFQLSGHEVLVLSAESREMPVFLWPWASSAQQPTHGCTRPSWHPAAAHTVWILNASTTMNSNISDAWFSHVSVADFLQRCVPTPNPFDIYIMFSPLHAQWQLYSAGGQSSGKEAVVYMRLWSHKAARLM